jgi:DNA-binding SARP family transcriptional activator/tetratricopeptide (TPR) repeat protein
MIRIRTLGECVIEVDDVRLQPKSQQLFATLLFLVLQAGKRITRQRLAGVLWPHLDERRSLTTLRQIVYALRRMGVDLHWDPLALYIPTRDIDLDVDRVLARYLGGSIDPDGPIGAFLTGYVPKLSPEFASWLDGERARRHTALTSVLLKALHENRLRGRWPAVDLLARRCLACDPLNEEATLAIAEAAAMTGRKVEALDTIDRYLRDLDGRPTTVRIPAELLRVRIADHLPQPPNPIDTIFVGRDEDLAHLNGLVQQARGGHGGAALLWGPPGIGKARTAHEVGRLATLMGVHIVSSLRQESDVRRPLSLFADLTPVLQDLPGALGCSPVTLRYLARLTGDDPGPVAGIPDPGDEGVPGYVLAAVRRALADLIAAVSEEQTILFIIEHVHHLDPISTEILSDLVADLDQHHIAIVMTAPTPFPPSHPLAGKRHLITRELRSLIPEESERLLHALIHNVRGGLDPETVSRYTTLADGNPYFLHELAIAWMYYGENATVPGSLTTALTHRISTLSEPALRVLQSATLLGPNSTFARLERTTHYSHVDLLRTIDELHRAGLLRPTPGPLSPRHSVVADAATDQLTPMARQYLHRRIAIAMEHDLDPATYTVDLWDCAQHYVAAEETQLALDVIGRCADKLFDLNLARETLDLWTRARELCRTDEQRLRLVQKLISTQYALDDLEEVKALAVEMEELRLRVQPSEHVPANIRLDVLEARRRTAKESVEPLCSTAFELLSNPTISGLDRARAGLCAMLASTSLYDKSRLREAYGVLKALSRRSRHTAVQRAMTELIFHTEDGDLKAAAIAGAEFVALARSGNSLANLAQALRYSAKPLRWLGRFDAAGEALLEALEIAERLGSAGLASLTMRLLAELSLEQGDLNTCETWVERGLALTPEPHRYQSVDLQYLKTIMALIRGETDVAGRIIEESELRVAPPHYSSRYGYHMLGLQTLFESHSVPGSLSPSGIEFLRLFAVRQSFGDQDVTAYSADAALRSAGRPQEALMLLHTYCTEHRREQYPLPSFLGMAVDSPSEPRKITRGS